MLVSFVQFTTVKVHSSFLASELGPFFFHFMPEYMHKMPYNIMAVIIINQFFFQFFPVHIPNKMLNNAFQITIAIHIHKRE